ncbi:MAG: competence/damage-inducible protein A [Gemmatimonadales bacterium]
MSSAEATAGPVAALVTVGNELLYGETVDTNAAWMARSLTGLGIPVVRKVTVGDVVADIQIAVRSAMEVADLVVVSGGLGPTADDVTKAAVARMMGLELEIRPDLLERLEAYFRSRGYASMPALNRTQAEVPAGATVLHNPAGTAPGLALESGGVWVVLLPGVPRELRAIFAADLRTFVLERFGARARQIHHRTLHTTGIAESKLAELVESVRPVNMGPVTLAYLPDVRGVDIRLSARGVPADEAESWLARIESQLAPVVAPWRFEAESGDIVEALASALRRAGKHVAVAESCTGGLIAKRITDQAGASDVFVGGIVAYANEVKIAQLGVSPQDLARHGAVSEPVARQMARGVADRFGAAAGIGITGIAGPGGGTPDKPVGTVWRAISLDGEVEARLLTFVGDREAVRERAAQEALAALHRRVVGAQA